MAWDKKSTDNGEQRKCDRKGAKVYGFYASVKDFYMDLLTLPAGRRYGYEMIVENKPCRNYTDVEWEGDHDAKHEKIRVFVRHLRAYCKKAHPCEAELVVSCSTRVINETAGRWKNSYHIVVTNLVFKNNHDGVMAEFWNQFKTECLADDEWHWIKDGAKKHCIDTGVYTRNRPMRLPLCSKRETDLVSDIAFQRINGHPLDPDDVSASTYDETDPDA